jgi:GntR family histidine utilization transcriptional repressor
MTFLAKAKPGPLYERVKQHIVERISSGEWADGTRLPSEHELVGSLGVSRMTVHRALRELSGDGVLSRIQGVGTFVAKPKAKSALVEIQDIADDIVSRGHRHHARVVTLEAIRADAELAASFDLRPGAKIFHSLIVHDEDEVPVQLEERFVTPFFAPHYLEQDFTRQTTTPYLQNISPPAEVEHVIFAVRPDEWVQKLLAVAAAEPCLMLLRRTWTAAGPATKSVFTYPGDRYSLGSRYRVG